MEVRHLSAHDSLCEISRIYELSWKYAYKGIIPQAYLDSIPEGKWALSITKDGMNNLVAEENGKIIGTSCYCRSRWEKFRGFGEIVSIYFLPEHMGKGHGSALLGRAVGELKKLGFREILLWVLEANVRAKCFYERNGFVPTDEYMSSEIGGRELREQMYLLREC